MKRLVNVGNEARKRRILSISKKKKNKPTPKQYSFPIHNTAVARGWDMADYTAL